MPTIGFIYPDHAAEDEYPFAANLLGDGIRLPVAHIYGTDLHAVPELLDLGSEERLAEGARLLAGHEPDAVVWACTSGSFVYRWDGATDQAAKLAEAAGKPASSTSFAFVNAARALGVGRVAVAASYPADVAEYFVEFLGAGGVQVVAMGSEDIDTAAEVGRLPAHAVIELALSHDHPDAEAVLVPDTAMRTLGVLNEIETRLGKPVLSANQVTIWEGLRLAGAPVTTDTLGTLFRTGGA
ncbi:maleate cis-trans isomerase family protein [Allokutzneria oryzae]|uniref:Maleate cis-trans isomerase n=1 Tax=Allokutzneria oryzae TaxID=1378989 RepID=A0ABV5ZYD8_9PSEU